MCRYGHPDAKRNPRLLERLIRNLGMGVSDREDAARNNVKDSASGQSFEAVNGRHI